MKLLKNDQALYLIVILGFVLRIVTFPFSQEVDADAITRVLIADDWLQNPHLIYEGIWLPFHYYFNALPIAIFGEHVVSPIIFQILITSLTAIPIYHFTKREFSEKGAWFAASFYLLCPVVFRNSFQTVSDLPYAFFVAIALNYISKSIRDDDFRPAIYAGLSMTFAAGFRYEAWLLIAVFTGIYLLFKKWKYTIYFWVPAMIFPLFWMVGNYIAHQNIFYGLSGTYFWNVIWEGINENITYVDKIKRVMFFPVMWFFYFSPILVIWVIWSFIRAIKQKRLKRSILIWTIPFWVFLITLGYKAHEGTLLLFYRYNVSLILLSAPFTALIFESGRFKRLTRIAAVIILASLIPMSYVWMTFSFEKLVAFSDPLNAATRAIRADAQLDFHAIPRLYNQNFVEYSKEVNKKITEESGLILDFAQWDNTFYLALKSELPHDHIYLMDGAKHAVVYNSLIEKILDECPTGVIMLKCYTHLADKYEINGDILTFNLDSTYYLKLTPVDGETGVGLFSYEVVESPATNIEEPVFECPEKDTMEYILFQMRYFYQLLNDIYIKARASGKSFDQQMMDDAQWIYDHNVDKNE